MRYSIRPLPVFRTLYPSRSALTYLVDGRSGWGTSYMFYIEGPSKNIIVDASPSAEQVRELLPPGFSAEPLASFEDALANVGLKPKDVDILILTHLHQDHALNADKFTKAEVYVQEDEFKFARSPHIFWSATYAGVNIDSLSKMKLRLIRGEHQLEGSIKLILTPGHTPGTQSIVVETSAGKAVIVGFCSIKENFEPPENMKARGIEVIPPGLFLDFEKAYDSALKVKRTAKLIIPCHENDLPKRIP